MSNLVYELMNRLSSTWRTTRQNLTEDMVAALSYIMDNVSTG